jgi:heavy metal efflux system protein
VSARAGPCGWLGPPLRVTIPDAFVGGILALFLAGQTWNVSSLLGLIGLFGIAVENGLVIITQTRA